LDTHIEDVLGVLEYEDLHDVILVGHSYAGMVIAGVAEKAAERIAHLVYLDAFVPADGKSLTDYQPPPAKTRTHPRLFA
jgi:pimeloyl-ACP methyl ester carboxylesterase